MRFLHIVTVGTSILRNAAAAAERGVPVLEEHREVLARMRLAAPGDPGDVEAYRLAHPSSRIVGDLVAFVSADPYRASAELNAFLSYVASLGDAVHDVVLFPTDTGVSKLAAVVIKRYLELHGLEAVGRGSIGGVEARDIRGYGRDFWPGLLSLLKETKKLVAERRDRYDRILVNLTAGFKPESGYLLLASSLFGVDTAYYIHEAMRRVVEIPLLPLRLSDETIAVLEAIRRGRLEGSVLEAARRMGLVRGDTVRAEIKELAEILLGR